MKHRLVQYLVEEMGYRAFVMEINADGALSVNDYILNGQGTIEDALTGLGYNVYQTEEVRDMLQWMKEYNDNADNESKIKFYGMDCRTYYYLLKYIDEYAAAIDKDIKKEIRDNLKEIYSYPDGDYNGREYKEICEGADNAIDLVKSKAGYCSSNNLKEEYDSLLYTLHQLKSSMEYYGVKYAKGDGTMKTIETRDRIMAENISYIYDYELEKGNDKVIVWAHNLHIGSSQYDWDSLGWNLKKVYGEEYYALGFEFLKGKFSSVDSRDYEIQRYNNMKEFEAPDCDPQGISILLDTAGIPNYFIKVSNTGDKELDEKLSEKLSFHGIGCPYYVEYRDTCFRYEIPNTLFDGLIYIRDTTASKVIK